MPGGILARITAIARKTTQNKPANDIPEKAWRAEAVLPEGQSA